MLDLGRPLNHCLRRLQVSLRWRLVDRNSLDLILRSVCVHEELELVLHLLLHLLQELLTENLEVGLLKRGATSLGSTTTSASPTTTTATTAATTGVVPEKC